MKGIRVGRLELCEARAFVIDAILRANGILLTTLVALAALFLIPSNSTFLYYWQGGLFLEGFEVVRWIIILFIGSLYFFSRDGSRDAFVLITLALALAALLPTLLYEGSKELWAHNWLAYVAVAMLVSMLVHRRPKELLAGVLLAACGLSVCNVVSMVLFPGGVYAAEFYFYDNRNAAYQISFLSLACSLLLDYAFRKRFSLRSLMVFVVVIAQTLLSGSATTSLAMLFLVASLLAIQKKRMRGFFNGLTMLVGSGILFLLVVVVRIENHMGPFIAGVFGKSITFSGRTPIWDLVFALLDGQHVFFGYGVSGNEYLIINQVHYYHTHNIYLDILFTSGLIGLVLMLCLLGLTAIRLYKSRHNISIAILSSFLGAYLIVGIMEPMANVSFFLFISLAYYWSKRGRQTWDGGISPSCRNAYKPNRGSKRTPVRCGGFLG